MEWGIRERSQNTVCQHETLHQGLGGATLNFGGGVGSSVWSDLKGWVSRRGGQTGQSWCLGGTASASAGLKAGVPWSGRPGPAAVLSPCKTLLLLPGGLLLSPHTPLGCLRGRVAEED